VALLLAILAAQGGAVELARAPAPADNPLKGFVPYAGEHAGFPHSLEWFYLPLADVMTGPDAFDWAALEKRLEPIAARGHQAILRFWLDYPGRPSGLPEFLRAAGVTVRAWKNPNADGKTSHTPDYEDPRLRAALRSFLAAFGRRYDGDARLGFLTAGLLGTWGEWHEHPHAEWFASKAVQREVLEGYAAAFRRTPVLLRYPAGRDDPRHVENAERPFGYHDDSFCWATLPTGRREDDWFFGAALKRAGAEDAWRTRPIGGEVRPEVQRTLWDEPTGAPRGQEFGPCVEATHATWLLCHALFSRPPAGAARERALAGARRLGYELQVTRARIPALRGARVGTVELTLKNHGVAPFYGGWPAELAAARAGAEPTVWPTDWRASAILPGEPETLWSARVDASALAPGDYALLVRVKNPLPNGRPLRFANATQDADRPGWLTVGTLRVD
jgi:hypothetical protein